jgi:WhiB family redox-sensing transcriptional regulator
VNPVAVGPVLIDVPEWMDRARCAGLSDDTFYPTAPRNGVRTAEAAAMERRAKYLCERCVVRVECLAFALQRREPHGIWGGLVPAERQQIIWWREECTQNGTTP